jgi:hypothetical protein
MLSARARTVHSHRSGMENEIRVEIIPRPAAPGASVVDCVSGNLPPAPYADRRGTPRVSPPARKQRTSW